MNGDGAVNVQVVTDSISDSPRATVQRLGIKVIAQNVQVGTRALEWDRSDMNVATWAAVGSVIIAGAEGAMFQR